MGCNTGVSMTKELFVSSTPHETKVGLVEDDQLAEVYLERENEYTLAGSIYKGRVTRVLPGMQSAFVDIGLERDAFLYVSDFMELEEHDEDVTDVVPVGNGVQEFQQPSQAQPRLEQATSVAETSSSQPGPSFVIESEPLEEEQEESQPAESPEPANHTAHVTREPREWRGRRRRRGRRGDRGIPESRFARASADNPAAPRSNERSERSDRSEYGPPPGYQPIILPGESISKYQRFQQQQTTSPSASEEATVAQQSPPLVAGFSDDEPMFAKDERLAEQQFDLPAVEYPEGSVEQRRRKSDQEVEDRAEVQAAAQVAPYEQQPEPTRNRYEATNVAASFGEEVVETGSGPSEVDAEEDQHGRLEDARRNSIFAAPGTMEEEEIEEEEADLASYVEEIEQDAHFEELEEETQAADGVEQAQGHRLAASGETEVAELSADATTDSPGEPEISESAEDDESELEEAQEEAEALLDAEARGNGSVDARAEVRASSGNAGYQQRARRHGWDRRGRSGRRGGGGPRRFRPRREFQNQATPLISDLLKEGQEILVQIAKEPIGKKGARITSHIALPGRFLVYMPTVNHTGVSRKIASEEERQRLKRIVLSERENGHGGFIVRTAAQGAAEEELRADIRFLKGLWNEIKTRAENSKAPALIYHDLNVVERVLRDQVTSDFSQIWVDTEQEYERILRFANRFQPALVKRVKLYSKETPLFEQFGLTDEINKALKSKVWLKSGGYIVINQTEALVAIDINTGKYVGKTSRLEDTIVKTNVDAIREIVRQIRLRDLGGIIIIDFIDMDERRNRQKVMQALEEALRSDRAPSKVLQFNDFGLVAITRKRVKQSLERTIGTPCPYCTATGYVKSVTTICNEIYTEMRKITKHLDHTDVMLRVNPEVAKTLKSNNGRWLTEMEELTGETVIVKSDPALHQEQFDIN
jgi:Rne/Rng family ribonuclease